MNESAPYPELQEGSPDSNPDGRAQELAELNGFDAEDLRRVLVRVGNLLEGLYDGGIVIPDFSHKYSEMNESLQRQIPEIYSQ